LYPRPSAKPQMMSVPGFRPWPPCVLLAFAAGAWSAALPASASASEQGRLLSRAFQPADYQGEIQVADVVQTPDGLIYAANLGAVKEYDGHAWRTIPVPTSWILDLQSTPGGEVLIAGMDVLGFLAPGTD